MIELNNLVERLEFIRAGFGAAGFSLHEYKEKYVEAMRKRQSDEISYRFYKYEILKESIVLYQTRKLRWNTITRQEIQKSIRSIYLDSQQSKIESDYYSDIIQDYNYKVQLDPNEILFNAWPLNDREVLGKNFLNFRETRDQQFDLEVNRLCSKFEGKNTIPSKLSSRSVVELISTFADDFKFEIVLAQKSGNPRCVIRHQISDSLYIFLEWFDYKLFRLNGTVHLRFIISQDKTVSWVAENLITKFTTDISIIIPGAGNYSNSETIPNRVALSVFAFMSVMRLCGQSVQIPMPIGGQIRPKVSGSRVNGQGSREDGVRSGKRTSE